MEKGVASAIWWIRPSVLQVRVNLSPFPLIFIYSSIMGAVDMQGSFGDTILGLVHVDVVLKIRDIFGFFDFV